MLVRSPSCPARARAVGRRAGLPWLAAMLASPAAQAATAAAPAGPLLADLLLLGTVAGLAGLAGWALGRMRLQAALRDARWRLDRRERQDDALTWETDAAHRLVHWRADTPGPPLPASPDGDPHAPIARRFSGAADPGAADTLQRHMDTRGGFTALDLLAVDGSGLWRLSGEPRLDAEGRFAGYLGRARHLQPQQALRADAELLAVLWAQWAAPAMTWHRAGPDAPWRLSRANAAAARLLGADAPAAGAEGLAWEAALQRLPPVLREALAALRPGDEATAGEWKVALQALPEGKDGTAGRLLTFQPAVAGPGAADAAEQETFIYTVSHDLRAPIRVVEGFTRILKEDHARQLDRIGHDHLDRVLGAAARMHSMIDALLSLSRLQTQPLQRQPVDLSQLARFIVDDLRRDAGARSVEVSIESGLTAHGDPTLLRVALDNLLGNAWKYTARTPKGRIEFRRETIDGRAVFVIADNGAGFDMRFADRLFGVFQRLHSANDFQGTGVGLASTRRIIRRHGGEIWADGEVNRGARFYFTLR
jgi:signal transduction histidine kinase